jgi:hypothetical protein
MRRQACLSRAGSVLALMCLTACAAMPPPPTLTLEGKACVSTPDLASAKPLPLATNKPVTVNVDDKTACLEGMNGEKNVYLGFQLPQSESEYLISVSSAPVGQGLLWPRVWLVDADGKTLREVMKDAFVFHGAALYVGLRVHRGERYLIVASDATAVGQEVSHIVDTTMVSTAVSGGFYIQVHTGSETTNTYVYALNGIITVAAEPVPLAK